MFLPKFLVGFLITVIPWKASPSAPWRKQKTCTERQIEFPNAQFLEGRYFPGFLRSVTQTALGTVDAGGISAL